MSVSIPVIGNGDVFKPEDAKDYDGTNCDAIMIEEEPKVI